MQHLAPDQQFAQMGYISLKRHTAHKSTNLCHLLSSRRVTLQIYPMSFVSGQTNIASHCPYSKIPPPVPGDSFCSPRSDIFPLELLKALCQAQCQATEI